MVDLCALFVCSGEIYFHTDFRNNSYFKRSLAKLLLFIILPKVSVSIFYHFFSSFVLIYPLHPKINSFPFWTVFILIEFISFPLNLLFIILIAKTAVFVIAKRSSWDDIHFWSVPQLHFRYQCSLLLY